MVECRLGTMPPVNAVALAFYAYDKMFVKLWCSPMSTGVVVSNRNKAG